MAYLSLVTSRSRHFPSDSYDSDMCFLLLLPLLWAPTSACLSQRVWEMVGSVWGGEGGSVVAGRRGGGDGIIIITVERFFSRKIPIEDNLMIERFSRS